MRGDVDGALASYRKAVNELTRAGQDTSAGDALLSFSSAAILMGEDASALSFARQQKLHGEELPAVAFLEAVRGDQAAAQRDLRQYTSAQPWISSRFIDLQRANGEIVSAILRRDGRSAIDTLSRYPDFQRVHLLYDRGRAHLLLNDYASAESQFRAALQESRTYSNFGFMRAQVPLFTLLSHYYLGQLYEKTGKSQQAVDEYQSFLSHFEGSRTKMSQVTEARSALARLMR
jgi:tetratricopeptide (TPR) repeat protein